MSADNNEVYPIETGEGLQQNEVIRNITATGAEGK